MLSSQQLGIYDRSKSLNQMYNGRGENHATLCGEYNCVAENVILLGGRGGGGGGGSMEKCHSVILSCLPTLVMIFK